MFSLLRTWIAGEGIEQAFRGVRTGDQRALYTGAAILGVLALRRLNRQKTYLLRSEVLEDGDTYIIRTRTRADTRDMALRFPDGTVKELSEAKRKRKGRTRSAL